MNKAEMRQLIEGILGVGVQRSTPLGGGCLGDVRRIDLEDGRIVVAKGGQNLEVEGRMLGFLKTRTGLPVPDVIHADDQVLIMDWIDGAPGMLSPGAERDLAAHVAALHDITASAFGFEWDTVIGPLGQPNGAMADWPSFFAGRRLMHMARLALDAGQLPDTLVARIERLAAHIGDELDHRPIPSLLHGDLWGGNILVHGNRIAGFIDPAIYFGDPEVELAFMTLFGTVGPDFFAAYRERRPIAPGFEERRRHIYLLYPLLVHVRLFGGSYVAQVAAGLDRLGY
jgi:fructosamine-3-kinase